MTMTQDDREHLIRTVFENKQLTEAEQVLEIATEMLHSIEFLDLPADAFAQLTSICNQLTELGVSLSLRR